ncbi:MAG TPA: DUF4870 domain-containing protein [Pseudoxanthomonas sp.]|nr:DUF4870 domain-containing protein [Pseudoxanthomonas sp.]
MSEFDSIGTPPPAPTNVASQEARTLAMVAHLLGILTGFIGPLIIWLINKDNLAKSFVTDQSKEALNFQITFALVYIVAMIVVMVSLGLLFFLPMLVWVANLVMCILAGVKANNGEAYRYPFALRLVK